MNVGGEGQDDADEVPRTSRVPPSTGAPRARCLATAAISGLLLANAMVLGASPLPRPHFFFARCVVKLRINQLVLVVSLLASAGVQAQHVSFAPVSVHPVFVGGYHASGSVGHSTSASSSDDWILFPLLGIPFFILVCMSARASAPTPMGQPAEVLITSTPPGEAPVAIREAWVGLKLPLADGQHGPVVVKAMGAVTGVSRGTQKVYAVPALDAIDSLKKKNPDAARWWLAHVNLSPQLHFDFPMENCKRVG